MKILNRIGRTGLIRLLLLGCIPSAHYSQAQESSRPGKMMDSSNIGDLKLVDFRPRSYYGGTPSYIPTAKFPAIDLHSHPYAKTIQEVDQWVKTMDSVGMAKTVVMTYATGTRFDSLMAVYGRYPDRFILFCGFDYTGYDQPGFGPAAVKELERCVRLGARGVGELGDKGKGLFYSKPSAAYGMHIDDERMVPLIKKCGELGIPISIHVAEPIWMYLPMDAHNDGLMNAFKWRLDNQKDILDHAEMVSTLENAVKRHPQTNFIACHYANCGYDLSILGRLFDLYPNLYADIGARFAEVAPIPRSTSAFFSKYQDRLFYGTDMGLRKEMYRLTFRILESPDEHFYAHDTFSYHWALHGLDLDDEILAKIYRFNALKILNLD